MVLLLFPNIDATEGTLTWGLHCEALWCLGAKKQVAVPSCLMAFVPPAAQTFVSFCSVEEICSGMVCGSHGAGLFRSAIGATRFLA